MFFTIYTMGVIGLSLLFFFVGIIHGFDSGFEGLKLSAITGVMFFGLFISFLLIASAALFSGIVIIPATVNDVVKTQYDQPHTAVYNYTTIANMTAENNILKEDKDNTTFYNSNELPFDTLEYGILVILGEGLLPMLSLLAGLPIGAVINSIAYGRREKEDITISNLNRDEIIVGETRHARDRNKKNSSSKEIVLSFDGKKIRIKNGKIVVKKPTRKS